MKAQSNAAPQNATIEPHPQIPGMAIVTLHENVKGPNTDGLYEYDLYRVVVPLDAELPNSVAQNPAAWLSAAKSIDPVACAQAEADKSIAMLDAAVLELEYQNALLTLGIE